MKGSPNKQGGNRNHLLWLLLVILAVCVAILLFLYGQQSGYTILKPEPSQTESTTTSGEEEVSSEGEDSTSKTSSQSSRTSSRTSSQEEETESSQPAQSLPESLGETPTPILSQSETDSTSDGSSSTPPSDEAKPNETNSQQISGLTIQWESQEQYAFALFWGEYAQQEPLFSALEEQGTPVTIYLYAAVGTDSVFWDNTYYCVLCYAGTGTMEQIYWDIALLLEEVLRQRGRWEESAGAYQNFNPVNFTYGEAQALYVGRYFCSLESQQSLTQDRLEVWLLVLQGQEPDYGPLLEKFYCLQGEYERIVE